MRTIKFQSISDPFFRCLCHYSRDKYPWFGDRIDRYIADDFILYIEQEAGLHISYKFWMWDPYWLDPTVENEELFIAWILKWS